MTTTLEWPHGPTEDAKVATLKTQIETALSAGNAACAFAPSKVRAIFNSGALVIHGSASALAKTVNTVYGAIGASMFSKAAADMAALVGTVTNAKVNVFVFMVDATGALTSVMGTEGATLAAVVFPAIPTTVAVIGFVIVNPTGTGPFVGGTTALDDATVVPGAVYVNTPGAFVQPQ